MEKKPKSNYRVCMKGKLSSMKGLSKNERKLKFCSSAKICSKGVSEKEAIEMCLTKHSDWR